MTLYTIYPILTVGYIAKTLNTKKCITFQLKPFINCRISFSSNNIAVSATECKMQWQLFLNTLNNNNKSSALQCKYIGLQLAIFFYHYNYNYNNNNYYYYYYYYRTYWLTYQWRWLTVVLNLFRLWPPQIIIFELGTPHPDNDLERRSWGIQFSVPQINIVKLADLRAHNASLCEVLWACRSAIFTIVATIFDQFL